MFILVLCSIVVAKYKYPVLGTSQRSLFNSQLQKFQSIELASYVAVLLASVHWHPSVRNMCRKAHMTGQEVGGWSQFL